MLSISSSTLPPGHAEKLLCPAESQHNLSSSPLEMGPFRPSAFPGMKFRQSFTAESESGALSFTVQRGCFLDSYSDSESDYSASTKKLRRCPRNRTTFSRSENQATAESENGRAVSYECCKRKPTASAGIKQAREADFPTKGISSLENAS